MMKLIFPLALLFSGTAVADTVVPVRTLRPNTVIAASDIAVKPGQIDGAATVAADVVGMEARVALYPGRPIRLGDIGIPAVVDRNQIVALYFRQGGLMISTDARALSRGGPGDIIRVMNLSSRATIFGQVQLDGSVRIER